MLDKITFTQSSKNHGSDSVLGNAGGNSGMLVLVGLQRVCFMLSLWRREVRFLAQALSQFL